MPPKDFSKTVQDHLDAFFSDVDELTMSMTTTTPPTHNIKSYKGTSSPQAALRLQPHQQTQSTGPAAAAAVYKYDSGSIVSFVAASGMSSVLFPQASPRYSVGSGRGSSVATALGDFAPSAQHYLAGKEPGGNIVTPTSRHGGVLAGTTGNAGFAPVTAGASAAAGGDAFAALGSDWDDVHRQHQLMRLGSSGIQTTTTGTSSTSFRHTTSTLLGSSESTTPGLQSPGASAADGPQRQGFHPIPSMAQLVGATAAALEPLEVSATAESTSHITEQPVPPSFDAAVSSAHPVHQQHLSLPQPRGVDRQPSPKTATIVLPTPSADAGDRDAFISSPQSAASAPSPHFLMNDSHSNSNSAEHQLQPPPPRSPLTKEAQSSASGRNSSSAQSSSSATTASLLLLVSDLRAALAPLFPSSQFAHRGSLQSTTATIEKGRRTASSVSEAALNFSSAGILNSSIGAGGVVVPVLQQQRSSVESNVGSIIFQQQHQQRQQEFRLPFQYRPSFSSISQNGAATAMGGGGGGSPRVSPRPATVPGVPRPPPPPSSVYFMRLRQLPSDSQDTRNIENSQMTAPSLSPIAEILQPDTLSGADARPPRTHQRPSHATPPSHNVEHEFVPVSGAAGVSGGHSGSGRSPRAAALISGCGSRDDLLISVAHPGVAASSLLVSFGWDSDVTHLLDDDYEELEEEEELLDGVSTEDVESAQQEGADGSSPQHTFLEPHPPAPASGLLTAAAAYSGRSAPATHHSVLVNRPLIDAASNIANVPQPPPPPPPLFSLTPIISNNYVLLGGLGNYRWQWEKPQRHQPTLPSGSAAAYRSSAKRHCVAMREDVLLAFSLQAREAVVVKMLSPLSTLASLVPHAPVGALPVMSPQPSDDVTATSPNTMGNTVVATGRALRQARIAAGIAELRKLVSLQHPNIVTLIDVLVDAQAGCFYLVQEHCDGGTIADFMATTKSRSELGVSDPQSGPGLCHEEGTTTTGNGGVLSVAVIATFLVHVLRGLVYLHQHGIAHRSIGLGTIMVTYSGVARLCGAALPPECSRQSAAFQNAVKATHLDVTAPRDQSLFAQDIRAVGRTFAALMPDDDDEHTSAFLRRCSVTVEGPDGGDGSLLIPAPMELSAGTQEIACEVGCTKSGECRPPPAAALVQTQQPAEGTPVLLSMMYDNVRIQLQLLTLMQEMSSFEAVSDVVDGNTAAALGEVEYGLVATSFLKRAEVLEGRLVGAAA
jgi:hypothetical protein